MKPTRILLLPTLMIITLCCSAARAQPITSGFDLFGPPTLIPVPFDPTEGHWLVNEELIFDPTAPPMIKEFESPVFSTGQPILLDALQPLPFPIWENFLLHDGMATNPSSLPVSDWHEEILEPGWEWVLPGDSAFPDLFPPGESLITNNGEPWPWEPIPMPSDPSKLWVEFPPILPGEVLDIHKALLWVGTSGNRFWGDGVDDMGIVFNESFISVVEYPTPEPSTMVLAAIGGFALLGLVQRRRREA